MAKAVTLPGDRLAGMQVDLLQKLRSGVRTLDELNRFLQGKNPFVETEPKWTEVDGNIHFELVGLGLPAAELLKLCESKGHKFYKWAWDVLSQPDYDENHRCEPGKVYKMGLVSGVAIKDNSQRTTKNLQALGCKTYGEQGAEGLKAELAILIRLKFSNSDLKAMGLEYIAVLHKPIVDFDGNPFVLCALADDDDSYVCASFDNPHVNWDDYGAFAFFAG